MGERAEETLLRKTLEGDEKFFFASFQHFRVHRAFLSLTKRLYIRLKTIVYFKILHYAPAMVVVEL